MMNSKKNLGIISTLTFLLSTAPIVANAAGSVWTMRYDNNRSSTYLSEKLLNTSNVNTSTFGKLFSLASDDQLYATPLYISDVKIGAAIHNVIFFASVNNTVYAYDADDGELLDALLLSKATAAFCVELADAVRARCSLATREGRELVTSPA